MTDLPQIESSEPQLKTKVIVLGDRGIEVQEPSELQISILGRSFTRVRKALGDTDMGEATPEQTKMAMDAIAMWLDVMESYIVRDADRDWLVEQMVTGKLRKFTDMLPLLSAFEDEEPEKPNRAARRARR